MTPSAPIPFRRILLKVSGELFTSSLFGHVLDQLISLRTQVQIALVVGGGNVLRGGRTDDFARVPRVFQDQIGMCASLLNGLILKAHLLNRGMRCCVFGSVPLPGAVKLFTHDDAERAFEEGHLLIFAGGLGQPFLSTDTTAVLSALKIGCDVVLKGTKVDGLYDRDPNQCADAVFFKTVSHGTILSKNLKVMDSASVALARDFCLPIRVFNIMKEESLDRVLKSIQPFTHISFEGE